MSHKPITRFQRGLALTLAALLPLQGLLMPATAAAQVALADKPVFSNANVPGNLALALSVEWPTASRTAHTDAYSSASTFLGYFDPNKCYTYQYSATRNSTDTGNTSYFQPAGAANNRTCSGRWSGNFLNWAATAAIDPFRWAMTGGRRVVDTASETILEKGWHSGQGLFADRSLPANQIAGATPFSSASAFYIRINGQGFRMRFSLGGQRTFTLNYYNNTDYENTSRTPVATVTDAPANYDWSGSPYTGVNADNFSTQFTGTFTAPRTGYYQFRLRHDDGAMMWLNNTRIINNGNYQPDFTYPTNNSFFMNANQSFSIRIIQRDTGGGAGVRLEWALPNTNNQNNSGTYELFSSDPFEGTVVDYNNTASVGRPYDVTMRVKVCDPSATAGGVESNCKAYGSNYKPEGLVQKYAQDMRYSAFGYLNDSSVNRDGGVLRARQKFVAPTQPVPGQPNITNPAAEWRETDGTFVRNPDAADATATAAATGIAINDSGVINYLNNFGQLLPGSYKSNDPVNELFYAVMRYYRNLGNVSSWSNMDGASTASKRTYLDGFPVITNWDDPIQYSCQRNFVLGIGDIYTHRDKNVPGNDSSDGEPAMPGEVSADTTVNAMTATNKVGALQGIGGGSFATVASGASYSRSYMAGLAYDANTKDIRPDVSTDAKTLGKQTVQTYWVDVLEQPFVANNKFYLAAKFGGMKVPSNFDPYTFAGTIPLDWWSTNGEMVGAQNRPDNYFTAGRPDTMVAGLTRAFENIVGEIKAFTTSFSLAGRQLTTAAEGTASYAAQYDSATWSGELTGSKITIEGGEPLLAPTPTWTTAQRFENQLGATTGWDTNRRVVTWNPDATGGAAGVPFRIGNISTAQQALLNTTYVAGDDSANYLAWLRGDASREGVGYRIRSVELSTGIERKRLGDIVNSKVTVVGGPSFNYSDSANPGYSAFKEAHKNRQTMLYVGANDGMLHAFKGGLGADGGTELFAYIPSVLFHRNPTDATAPTNDGLLAQLGRPEYLHRNYVDANAKVYDVDFSNTGGAASGGGTGTPAPNDWRSVLIGGLGKGGRSYYAIDVTDPAAMTSEAAVAGKVLWEFPARSRLPAAAGGDCASTRSDCIDMGYSYGDPVVVKTAKHGWVVIFTSGYNNVDGKGHLFIVNPATGELLEDISTGETNSSGMARPTAYVRDYTDMTADSVYVGDLDGQLWRFALNAAEGAYPAPTKIAQLSDASGNAQPVTSRPLIEIHPAKRKRFVLVGTGRLLHDSDIRNAQIQTFYAIIDGGIGSYAAHRNDGEDWPVARADLPNVEDPEVGVNVDGEPGWRMQLDVGGETDPEAPSEPDQPGWRVVGDQADAYNGVVGIASFPTVLPTGDICSPSGISRAYALNYASGKTVLENGVAYVPFGSLITDLNFLTIGGKVRLVAGDNKGEIGSVPGTFGDPEPRRLSWREIPVGN